jgi:hypothetical protein
MSGEDPSRALTWRTAPAERAEIEWECYLDERSDAQLFEFERIGSIVLTVL